MTIAFLQKFRSQRSRPVVVHYHIFKNAGTSLDRTLRDNFGATWATLEGPTATSWLTAEDMAKHLAKNPWIMALSSHTTKLPPPTVRNVEIISLLLVRHPGDRARSVYMWERDKAATVSESTEVARQGSFKEYLEWKLDRAAAGKDHTIVNFQARVLGRATHKGSQLERAAAALDVVSCVGMVEEYEKSIALMQTTLSHYFPQVQLQSYRENVSAARQGIEERLAGLRAELGPTYDRLLEANQDDMAIWERVRTAVLSASG